MPALRIFLVDDHLTFTAALAQFLARDPRIEVVDQADSGTLALQRVAQVSPDLVLVDLSMPDVDGLAVTRQLKGLQNGPRVIILTIHDQPQYRAAASSAGADGFVSKVAFGRTLLPSIFALFPQTKGNEDDATAG